MPCVRVRLGSDVPSQARRQLRRQFASRDRACGIGYCYGVSLPESFLSLAVCAFLAGLVRGFSGFGLSAVLVASGSFFVAQRSLIPSAQALEVLASIWMIRSVWHDVNWKWLAPLAIAYAISIPVGVAALAYAPADVLRVGGCVLIFVASMALLFNARPKLPDGFPLRFGTGIVAGFMAGSSSLGGMVASVMLFAVSIPAKELRATLIVLFFGSSLYSLSWGTWHGVVTKATFVQAAWLAIPLLIGIAIGSRGFRVVSEAQFRKAVLAVLAALSIAGIASVLLR